MPMKRGKKNVGSNIQEFHKGQRYAAMVKKYGKKKADEIAVAAAERAANGSKKKKV